MTRVALMQHTLDPETLAETLEAFIVTPDLVARHYEFSSWPPGCYGYSVDRLPLKDGCRASEWKITQSGWDELAEALSLNDFFGLPQALAPIGGQGYATSFITVERGGAAHRSGGYGAGFRGDAEGKRFSNAVDAIRGCIRTDE